MSRNATLEPEAHESINRLLRLAWADVAPDIAYHLGRPAEGTPISPPALVVDWMDHGQSLGAWMQGMLQLNIFASTTPQALEWGRNLAGKLGRGTSLTSGTFGVFDFTKTPAWQVGEGEFTFLERGWVPLRDPKPSTKGLALTLIPRWRAGAIIPNAN